MKKFFLNNWQVVLLIVLSVLIVWPLFMPGYFSHHDDLQVMRIFEMRKCFTDLQLPCRWVPDMGYGNGYPLFNFYGVLQYYLGAVLSYVFGFIITAKILFFIPLLGGGIGMYLLAKELFGKIPGLVAGILFLFAPYRALDSYVRGDVAELFALSIAPLLLYFILKLVRGEGKNFFWLSVVSFTAFLLSHNITTLIFTPVIVVFTIYFLFENKWKNWKKILWVFILGAGLSAFFVVPAYLEKNLVQTEALTRAELDFRAQFVKVGQLFFDRSWNYGGSNPDETGTISYQIGWPYWWIAILSIALVLVSKKRKNLLLFVILISIFSFGVLMTHNKSAPIWEFIKILIYVQFPWRFLSYAIFASSLLGAYLASYFSGRNLWILGGIISLLAVVLNWYYFRPQYFYYDMTDAIKLSGQNFINQQKGSILDYLPKTALEPREPAPPNPLVIKGSATVNNFINKSNRWSFGVDVTEGSVIDPPVFDFPDWVVRINGKEVDHARNFPTGRIEINLPPGKYVITGEFKNTPVRTASNLLSLASLFTLIMYCLYKRKADA